MNNILLRTWKTSLVYLAAQEALEQVKATQSDYWDALRELETELGYDLDDDCRDYENYSIDDLLREDAEQSK